MEQRLLTLFVDILLIANDFVKFFGRILEARAKTERVEE